MSDERRASDAFDFVQEDDADAFGSTTRLVHYGESRVASAMPVYQSNTVDGLYVRMRNPTVEALEEKMRSLEGGGLTLALSSGMAAISHTLLGLLAAGDRMVVHRALFIGVQSLLDELVANLGIVVVAVDLNDRTRLARALETKTKLVYFETLTNPALELLDAPAIIAAARGAGALAVVDNTILTPWLFRPLEHGADVVVHSATKYLSGHGDVLAGFATFRDATLGQQVHKARRLLGGLLSPMAAFLVLRGMKTLGLRIERHCANALAIAEHLQGHPQVKSVAYPGLPSSRDHARARALLEGFGGVVSFEPADDFDWQRFAEELRLCRPWMSFGDVGTRVQREGPVRLSVGLEDVADLIADLERAFAACKPHSAPSPRVRDSSSDAPAPK